MRIKKISVFLLFAITIFFGVTKISFAYHFSTAVNYSVGNSPIEITTGDFNGDGILDFAVANDGSNNISVLIGSSTATGTFKGTVNYTAGSGPWGITNGDFNNDGILDLAVTNLGDNNVSVLLGSSTATGTFNGAVNYSVSANSPEGITTGDFNNDGILDLAIAANGANLVAVLFGSSTATGTFSGLTHYPTGNLNPVGITNGDFNKDGILDIAVTNNGSNNISILFGSSTDPGIFSAAIDYPVAGVSPEGIVTGDFNGDTILDLATANDNSNDISVLLGSSTATGTFSGAINYTSGGSVPFEITAGNFNGDSLLDLAVTNISSNNVSVFLSSSTATGTFSGAINYSVSTNPTGITSGDFDGDGVSDLAVSNENGNNISILLNIVADRFWVGGTGTWNSTDTTHWSEYSGGPGGASVPTNINNVFLILILFQVLGKSSP